MTKGNLGTAVSTTVSMPIANYMEVKAKASAGKPRITKWLRSIAKYPPRRRIKDPGAIVSKRNSFAGEGIEGLDAFSP
jgi:hypothetical protein